MYIIHNTKVFRLKRGGIFLYVLDQHVDIVFTIEKNWEFLLCFQDKFVHFPVLPFTDVLKIFRNITTENYLYLYAI